jgi:pimeloyl-ACP methyl ester carboxylesterase
MRIVVALAACGVLLAGCATPRTPAAPSSQAAGSPGQGQQAAPSPTDRRCADPQLNDKQVTFQSQGVHLAGYLLGTGPTTLVLAPQASADACSWLAWARQQAAAGYRVLAFDFNGEGRSRRGDTSKNSGDVEAAARFARERGATGVVLVGASRGGTAVLVAASRLDPPATAVLSLSGVDEYAGESAIQAVPRLTAPVLFLAATGDGSFPTMAKAMYDATPGDRRSLVVVPGQVHGTALLTINAIGTDEAGRAVSAFLTANAPR